MAPPGGTSLAELTGMLRGSDYAAAATRLVLGPLGMTSSTFPASWPHDDPDAVTGYELEPDGTFLPDLDDVAAIPAAAGLWTTAADLLRFGTEWPSLLPSRPRRRGAPRPQAAEASSPGRVDLGWRLAEQSERMHQVAFVARQRLRANYGWAGA